MAKNKSSEKTMLRPGSVFHLPSISTGWCFFMFAGLSVISCLEAILYPTKTALFVLAAAFAFVLWQLEHRTNVRRTARQKDEQRLKAIFQASPNPIIVYDKQGYPLNVNSAFTKIFGWSLDELKGRRIPFVPTEEMDKSHDKIKEIFRTGRPVSFDTRRMTKAGDIRNVIVSAAIVADRDDAPLEMVVNITDITETKKIEARLRQAHKMEAVGTLAGGIAHDFNNILSPMIGYGEMIKDDLPSESPLQESIDEILVAANRARELVKQILVSCRHCDTKPSPLKLQPIILETLKLIRSSIPATIEIKHDIDPTCGSVIADPTQIHQVVMNLATNAYHAMEQTGGKLHISLKQAALDTDQRHGPDPAPGKYARIIVSDTGIGIERNILDKIFDPYFSTKDKNKGTGLGLSVVRGIVNNCGGQIRVLSEPGRGSEFQLYFQLVEAEKQPAAEEASALIRGGAEKILIVDDEASVARMVGRTLERLGYQITIHTSSIQALAAFKADPGGYDLIFTDLTMPEMTGAQLAQEVLAIRSSVPVILSTGYSARLTPEMAESIGIKAVLVKPAGKSAVAGLVRRILDAAAAGA